MDEIYNLSPTKSYTAADILESVINPSSLSPLNKDAPTNLSSQNGSATSPEYYDVSSDDEPAQSSKVGNGISGSHSTQKDDIAGSHSAQPDGIAGSHSTQPDSARKAEIDSDSDIEEVKVINETNDGPDLEFEEIDEKDNADVGKPEGTVEKVNHSDEDVAEIKEKSAFDRYCDDNIDEVEKVRENGHEADAVVGKNHVSDADIEQGAAEKIRENGIEKSYERVSDCGEAGMIAGEVAKENGCEISREEMEVDKNICEKDAAIVSSEINVAEEENNFKGSSPKPVDERTEMSVEVEGESVAQEENNFEGSSPKPVDECTEMSVDIEGEDREKLSVDAVETATEDFINDSQDDVVPLTVECVIDEVEGGVDILAQGEDSLALVDGEKVDVSSAQADGQKIELKSDEVAQVESGDVSITDEAKVESGDSAVKTPKKKSAIKRSASKSERKSTRKVSFTKIDSGWELAAKKPKRRSVGGASPKSIAAKSPAKYPSKKSTTPAKKVSQETTPIKDNWLKPFQESPNFYVGPVVLPVLQPVLTLDRVEKFFYKAMLVGKKSQVDHSPSYNKAYASYGRSRRDDSPMEDGGRSTRYNATNQTHMMGPASRRAAASASIGPASKKIIAGPASKKAMAGPASKKVIAGPASKKVIAGPASKKVIAGPASRKAMAGPASKKVEATPAPAPRKMIACPASRKAEFMARLASPPKEVGRSLRRKH